VIPFPALNDPDYQSSKPLQVPPITFAIKKTKNCYPDRSRPTLFLSACGQKEKLSFRPEQGGLFFLLRSCEGAALRSGGISLPLSFCLEYMTFEMGVFRRAFPE